MQERIITLADVEDYRTALVLDEKSSRTAAKYGHDVEMLRRWLGEDGTLTREKVLLYKESLRREKRSKTVNTYIAALNGFFSFMRWQELRVTTLRIQKQMFWDESRMLSRQEYMRLLKVAEDRGNERLHLLMQAVCSTGIRISELQFITVEAAKCGRAEIDCKGKIRVIILPHKLCKALKKYARKYEIKSGPIFITRSGNVLDRSNVWRDMKTLCEEANVDPHKVFPHNLRHLFARTFYEQTKDIVKLADILGHSSIETTRVYTLSTASEAYRKVNRLRLVVG